MTMLSVASVMLITAMTISSVDRAASYEYMVIVPRLVWPNSILRILIHFSKPVQNETVTAEFLKVKGSLKSRLEESLDKRTINVPDGNTRAEITFQAPIDISWGFYSVNISAVGNIEFRNSSTIYGRSKANAIFIQTDKKTYKPGDTVHYRIFTVNSKLDLSAPVFNVEIKDPNFNKINELTNQRNYFGIEDSLELSSTPPLGLWHIVVKTVGGDELEHITFEVKEYVLPKFEVIVNLPSFGRLSDDELTGSVTAKYTFGKDVKGKLVVTTSKLYGGGFFDPAAIRTEMPIDGKSRFSIPMELLERVANNIAYNTIVVQANVTETVTGVTLGSQAKIKFYADSHTIEFHPSMPSNFKSGINPYQVLMRVKQWDGRPPQTTNERLKVTVSYFTDSKVIVSPPNAITVLNYKIISPFTGGDVILKKAKRYPLDKDGFVMFDLNIPEKAATVSIKTEYKDTVNTKNVQRFRTLGNVLLNAEMMDGANRSLKLGDTVTFKVTVNEGSPITANYLIISHGTVVKAGVVYVSGSNNEGFVEETITRAMNNIARFVVYYAKPDGEIIADGLNIAVEEIFENKVEISFIESSPQEPKSSVTLRVTTDPDSVVNVLAVDKSVTLLGRGNDIDKQRIQSDISKFDEIPWFPLATWGGKITPRPMVADDSYDIFREAQHNVLTDGNLYKFELWRLNRKLYHSRDINSRGGGIDRPMAAGFGGSFNEIEMDRANTGQSREYFPETWMWKSTTAENGVADFKEVIPDTITEFVANAFALNNKTGLGVAMTTANMTVFLPFFVNLQLPYSVVRNEIVVVQVNVFNYRNKDVLVNVVLRKSEHFVGITAADYGLEKEVSGDIVKCVTAKVNRTTPVFFSIKPTKIGNIALTVRATIKPPINLFDEIVRQLPVQAEGIPKEKNTPKLIIMKTDGTKNVSIPIKYPERLVSDSARIRVTVFGDIFGPSLQNLDSLIRIPSGCGEQNMVHFAPMIFAVNYMSKTGTLDNNKDLIKRIKRALRIGYQRQLTYQRRDGSFSPFGYLDKHGSVWLTTFVIKSFSQAHSLGMIYIDPMVVEKAVKFISRNQGYDGLMKNVGTVVHKVPAGESDSIIRSLSAYVLIALQELKKSEMHVSPNTISSINDISVKITRALISDFESMKDGYEMAITAYSMKLVGEPTYLKLLQALETSKTKVQQGGDIMYWDVTNKAMGIEIASYALLSYTLRKTNLKNARKIANWLIKQRNPYGGFISTQDTVVALQGLSEFASLVYSKEVNMDINVKANGKEYLNVKLTSENHDVLQYMDFPGSNIDKVEIFANGTGTALIDINQFFNVESESTLAYNVTVEVLEETVNSYKLHVCASYLYGSLYDSSNMAIMDIGGVSGLEPNKDLVEKRPFMRRLEMSSGRLIIYYDEIPKSGVCVMVPMQRTSRVAYVKPSFVVVYSYYEPDERVMVSYMPDIFRQRSLCSTCPECCSSVKKCKKKRKRRQRKNNENV